jgi:AcrR family transcriptional regulator
MRPPSLDATTPDELRPVLQPLADVDRGGHAVAGGGRATCSTTGGARVGVDLIAETAGTTKKTLYDGSARKDALVALYLLRRAHRWREYLLARLAAAEPDPRTQVLLVFDALEAWMGTQRRGCAFVNAYAELGRGDHPAVPVIRAEKAWMRALFDASPVDPEVGGHLHLLYEGTLVVLTAGANPLAAAEADVRSRSRYPRLGDG